MQGRDNRDKAEAGEGASRHGAARAPSLAYVAGTMFRPMPADWGGVTPTSMGQSEHATMKIASAINTAYDTAAAFAQNSSLRSTGILVALVSVVCASPDATFLRCLQHSKAPNLTILIWKMALYSTLQGTLAIHQGGGFVRVLRKAAAAWPWFLIGSLTMCIEWMATVANLTTSSASALCLFYIAPLWSVPMGMLVNKDPLHVRTLIAMVVALAGISLIFAPNVLGPNSRLGPIPAVKPPPHHGAHHKPMHHHHGHHGHAHHQHPRHLEGGSAPHAGPSSLFGDLAGLLSGLAFAAWMTTCRHAALHRPDAPLALCGSAGTLLVVVPAVILSMRQGDDLLDVSPKFVLFVLFDCAAIAAYNVGTMIASKYLPSAE